jgi:flagellar basal body-associated protein FliL
VVHLVVLVVVHLVVLVVVHLVHLKKSETTL